MGFRAHERRVAVDFMDFVPLAAPAMVVIGSAIWVTLREVRGGNAVIDLTDEEVPAVRLAGAPAPAHPVPPRSGNLVSAPDASLGARLQRIQSTHAGHSASPGGTSSQLRPRRTRPLVADRS